MHHSNILRFESGRASDAGRPARALIEVPVSVRSSNSYHISNLPSACVVQRKSYYKLRIRSCSSPIRPNGQHIPYSIQRYAAAAPPARTLAPVGLSVSRGAHMLSRKLHGDVSRLLVLSLSA